MPPLELYNNPRNRFVAGFLGSPKMNFLESTVAKVEGSAATVNVGGTLFTLRQQIADRPSDGKIVFGIRPEHMGITEAAGTKLADVRVDLVEQLGDQTMLYASTQGGQPLTIALNGQQNIASGATVTAYVDPGAVPCVCGGWPGDLAYQADELSLHLADEPCKPLGRGVVHVVEREVVGRHPGAEGHPGPAAGEAARRVAHDHRAQAIAAIGRDVGDAS